MSTQNPNGPRKPVSSGQRRAAQQRKQKKKVRNAIILGVELLVLVCMLAMLWFVLKMTDQKEGLQKVEIPTEEVVINEGVTENENLETYRTIALFGLDSTVGELTSNTRSDTIMIASLNSKTKEVRLMSVYRDTYLNLGNDTYNKCNAAYAKGGPKQAINMLNMNLDLDITDFVAVGFKGVADVVDAVGGVWVDITESELQHINNYQISISENLKTDYIPVKQTGYQKLDGIQATAYCRIRYGGGDDYRRTERQREILNQILEQAKKLDVTTLAKIANNVFGNVYTSIDIDEIVSLLGDLVSYELIDEGGFPMIEYRTTAVLGKAVGDSVICTDLEQAVTELHKIFFENEEYTPSKTVQEISATIHKNTDAFLSN